MSLQEIIGKPGAFGCEYHRLGSTFGIVDPPLLIEHVGRLAGYSMERLYRFLNALGQDVRIVVQPKPRTRRQATLRALVRKSA
jgi:hypothetical protein